MIGAFGSPSGRIGYRLCHHMVLAALFFLWGFSPLPGTVGLAGEYRAGVARVDITPDYPIRLNGFGFRRAESEGIYQRIWAKAIAIQYRDDPPVVLVALDSLGIRESMVNEVARRLAADTPIRRDRLAVTFTHSHTTPKVNGASDTIFSSPIPPEHQAHIDRYTGELTDALEKVCREALASLAPARLRWATGQVTFARNRRTPGGPVDHSLPLLVIYGEDGAIRAVLATYACHCVTLSHNQIGGDWAGYAQEFIERKFPGVVGLVSIGCGSDANPDSGVTGDKVDVARAQGTQIADEVERVIKAGLLPVEGPITAQLAYVDLPLEEPPSREQLQTLAAQSGAAAYNARFQLERLERGEKLLETIHYPVQSFSFGRSLHMVFLAGEVCVDYAIKLRKELDSSRLWIYGYSNDFCAYIPSERLLREGGYGGGSEIVYFALPSKFRPGIEQEIIDTVLSVTPDTFKPGKATQGVPPKSPQDSMGCMQLAPHFRVELVASEPLVCDPVAIEFAPDGSLWVAEMPDYAREVESESFEPSGRVKRLIDSDSDGVFDTAVVFLENLRFPTGVTQWRDGLLVCDAPDIIWARDTDSDGKADDVRVLYTGFATHNPHARVNSLRWGVDGWLYGSGGLFGGTIRSFSGQEIVLERQDFRIDVDGGRIEPATGTTQQGRCRDDWDNWFGCDNSNLAWHYPLFDHYLRRNKFAVTPSPRVSVPRDQDAARLVPPENLVLFPLSGAPGRATSACGVEIYRDNWLEELNGNLFTCEPVHQAVHRLVLEREGALVRGRRAGEESDREFLVSTDPWFRPVQLRTGPDGGLWVVDMYRYVIEHKRWIPQEIVERLDLFAGREYGRIYRIVPAQRGARPIPNLEQLSAPDWVALLDQPNGTLRDLAQMLLFWQKPAGVREALEHVVRSGRYPEGRMAALWTLALRDELDPEMVTIALGNSHPGVRRHALRVAERFRDDTDIRDRVVMAADDATYEVAYQAAYSLGEFSGDPVTRALARLAVRFAGDPYMTAAIASSLKPDSMARFWHYWPELEKLSAEQRRTYDQFAVLDVQMNGGRALAAHGAALGPPEPSKITPQNLRTMALLVDTLLRSQESSLLQEQWPLVAPWLDQARVVIGDASHSLAVRLQAVALIGACRQADDVPHLCNLLEARYPPEIQKAALEALAGMPFVEVGRRLVELWPQVAPARQNELLDLLLRRPAWSVALAEALEQNRIPPGSLDAARRQRLVAQVAPDLQPRLRRVFDTRSERRQVEEHYQAALAGGDPQRGRQSFAKHCAACHRWQDMGHVVGPDLTALANKSPAYLLSAIVDPNREVEPRYVAYAVQMNDGQVFTGILAAETSTSITLVEAEGKTRELLRAEIEQIRSTGLSLMPEGIERELSVGEMADLIALLMETPQKR
ncbi:MAG: hypothetical protein KatS3mg110_2003 [Pirellulaceae bacterium]|nr:MAG: hypothetical protein KatS3mg110_2003 [Pirellulaceae bacterium]